MTRLTVTTLLFNFAFVIGLKLERVLIPPYGVKDGWVSLQCDFLLENDKLLVLKWYKDGEEFFRYSPHISPPILIFPTQGVHVNGTQSTRNHVILTNISLQTSGTYKCEVSADAPSFRTLSEQREMIIIAPPTSDPEISGILSAISVGDMISSNCTSFRSQPPASLMFYINGEKAEVGEMIEYSPIRDGSGLDTSILGLHFQVETRHFRSGGLEIKCVASIGNSYRVKRIWISEANINAQPSVPAHNSRVIHSTATRLSCLWIIRLLSYSITLTYAP